MLCYLAGPIDAIHPAVASEVRDRRGETAEMLTDAGFAVYDPGQRPFVGAGKDPKACYDINEYAIRRAEAMLAILPEGVGTIGTPMEIQTAVQLGKTVAVVGGLESMQLKALRVKTFQTAETAIEWLKRNTPSTRLGQQIREAFQGMGARPAAMSIISTADGVTDEAHYWPPDDDEPELRWVREEEYAVGERRSQDLAPRRCHEEDAGFDLAVAEGKIIPAGGFVDVPCGIAVELPPGTWGLLVGRSSTFRKRGLQVQTGIIDGGYRGPLYAGVFNVGHHEIWVQPGERLAQLIPIGQVSAVPVEVDELGPSDRGDNGFGSTGR